MSGLILCCILIVVGKNQIEQIFAHARRELPFECCGFVGNGENAAGSVYELRNAAANRLTEYAVAPVELFAAQKLMRTRGEKLVGIYHSHPRQREPRPSETDVRLAFYADAVYFIVGFDGDEPILRAFRIFERERRWEKADFVTVD